MTTIIYKLLILNALSIPDEIVEYIKTYLFYNLIDKSRKIKNNMISIINNNLNSIHYSISMSKSYQWAFIVEQPDDRIICKFCDFCYKCGNYLESNVNVKRKLKRNRNYIICNCDLQYSRRLKK